MSFQLGKWLVLCDRCGFRRYSDQVVKTWDNLMVCAPSVKPGCYETRHPQDLLRAKVDDTSVPFVRPESADVFTSITYSEAGVQEKTIPTGTFTSNNNTL